MLPLSFYLPLYFLLLLLPLPLPRSNRVAKKSVHPLKNGILYLKGGDLTEELKLYTKATLYDLSDYFEEDFFETKKIVHLPLKYKG